MHMHKCHWHRQRKRLSALLLASAILLTLSLWRHILFEPFRPRDEDSITGHSQNHEMHNNKESKSVNHAHVSLHAFDTVTRRGSPVNHAWRIFASRRQMVKNKATGNHKLHSMKDFKINYRESKRNLVENSPQEDEEYENRDKNYKYQSNKGEELKNDKPYSEEIQTSLALIPPILHQTWITEIIPSTYLPFVISWRKHQPPLKYYFWTDKTSADFVAKHYPHLLDMFKGYKAHLNRADAIRYMLLHHYGGIYADMDMQRLRDLSPFLNSSDELCYLSQERYEITRLYWGIKSSVMNAIMLSSPGHKFMEYVVNALPRFAKYSPDVMESTGPFFLQNVFNEFNKSPPCDLAMPNCRCSAADPFLFMPQIDPIRIPLFKAKCARRHSLQQIGKEACSMLDKLGWSNNIHTIGRDSYTHHGFLHYGFQNQRLRFSSVTNISYLRSDKQLFGKDFQ